MNPIEQAAQLTHEVNRKWCQMNGDNSQVEWQYAPEWQKSSAINGVTAILEGRTNSPEEQHQSWCEEKYLTGWKYGETKDAEAKTHPCLVDYSELPPEQRMKDHLFRAVVKAYADTYL